jgi:hypothetical protein
MQRLYHQIVARMPNSVPEAVRAPLWDRVALDLPKNSQAAICVRPETGCATRAQGRAYRRDTLEPFSCLCPQLPSAASPSYGAGTK